MNIVKQPIAEQDLNDPRRPIVTFAQDREEPHVVPWHQHLRGQVLYASRGTMSVVTQAGAWAVPSEQAVWIPPNIRHEVRSLGALSMRSLYLDASVVEGFPAHCEVWNVSPLLRELIVALSALSVVEQVAAQGRRLTDVLLDQLRRLIPVPFHLTLPTDKRAREIAEALLRNPCDDRELSQLAAGAGASARTLARVFPRETGMSFGRWRQQVRVLAAVSKLGAGEPVTRVAYDLGYQSPSAFVAMFKRVLGEPPGRYFHRLKSN